MTTTAVASVRRGFAAWERVLRLLRRPAVKALLGAQLVALAVVLVRALGWLQPPELLVYDALRAAWAGHQAGNRILLIGVSDPEIDALNDHWPLWDADLADLLERLESWHPRVIGVDIYRPLPRIAGSDRLAQTLAKHPNIVWAFKLPDALRPGLLPPAPLVGTDRAVFADLPKDRDEVVRRGLLFADDGTNQYTGMGMGLALGYLAPDHINLQPGSKPDSLRLGRSVIEPLDDTRGPYVRLDSRGYQLLLDFRGGPVAFPLKSYGEIMQGNAAAPLVRDRAVIIGDTAESVHDSYATPFSTGFGGAGPVWGIALHAHVADQLIRQALDGAPGLRGCSRLFEGLWVWAWAMAGALLGLAVRSTLPAAGGAAAGLAAIAGIAYAAFGAGWLLPGVPAAAAWLGAVGLTNQLLHAASNRARVRLRRSFEHYLPPSVIAQMLKSDALPHLGGERREISVVFSDVAGFTTFSETMDPEELTLVTNGYFEGIGAAIFAEAGYINEFMGDGVLAFFGAPQRQPDHADRAVAAGLGIVGFGTRFSAEQRAGGIGFGHTRVGIHCGVAMVGNIGTPSRLKYGALGDILNTGSRLEGLNKVIGTRICVSQAIVAKSTRHRFRPIGAFLVKGRHEPTMVFEPVDGARYGEAHLVRYEAAFAALDDGDPRAARLFAELHRDDPEDPCVAFHHRRLEAGEAGTLIVMTEK